MADQPLHRKYDKRLHLSLTDLEARYPQRIGELQRHVHAHGRSSLPEESQLLWYSHRLITDLLTTLQENSLDTTLKKLGETVDHLEGKLLHKSMELEALYALLGSYGLSPRQFHLAGASQFLHDQLGAGGQSAQTGRAQQNGDSQENL